MRPPSGQLKCLASVKNFLVRCIKTIVIVLFISLTFSASRQFLFYRNRTLMRDCLYVVFQPSSAVATFNTVSGLPFISTNVFFCFCEIICHQVERTSFLYDQIKAFAWYPKYKFLPHPAILRRGRQSQESLYQPTKWIHDFCIVLLTSMFTFLSLHKVFAF